MPDLQVQKLSLIEKPAWSRRTQVGQKLVPGEAVKPGRVSSRSIARRAEIWFPDASMAGVAAYFCGIEANYFCSDDQGKFTYWSRVS